MRKYSNTPSKVLRYSFESTTVLLYKYCGRLKGKRTSFYGESARSSYYLSNLSHKAWHDASESIRKIKYPMLADPTGVLSRAFGVMIEEEGMAYRGTFLVNPEGKIKIAISVD